jgi:hypothetical protein
MTVGPLEIHLEDVVRLRKPHPCGSYEWTVVRLGADIGLRCHGCGHKVLLPRRSLEKRLKAFVARGPGFVESTPTTTGTPAEASVTLPAGLGAAADGAS